MQIPQLPNLEFFVSCDFWNEINTFLKFFLNKIYDNIDFDFGYKPYIDKLYWTFDFSDFDTLLWDIFSVRFTMYKNDVIYKNDQKLCKNDFNKT